MRERTDSAVNAGRRPAAIVLVGLLGLAGLVYMIWPRSPAIEHTQASAAGSTWELRADRALLTGSTMGTTFSVVVAGADLDRAVLARLQLTIDAELERVNDQMSTYRPDSELSRFNAGPTSPAVPVSPELCAVVRDAKAVSAASGGAFDVTVGPLVDAWGFGPGSGAGLEQRRELTDNQIAILRDVVGDAKLSVDCEASTLGKSVAGLRVDLSAIAKGHGCDRVAAKLDEAGLRDYMVEIGGEVRVRGQNPEGEAWRVGVERPTADAAGARAVQAILRVRDVSVATSGDYRNYWERDGVRYSHTIDPRTGRPIQHRLASATVIDARSAALADAWATALNVLGPDEGLALADDLGLAAYFLVRTDAGFEVRTSQAFAPYL